MISKKGIQLYLIIFAQRKQNTTTNNGDTARSAEVEPPGLGSKCGKWVERFSDFGKYKGNFRNHTTSLPAYRTLSKWVSG